MNYELKHEMRSINPGLFEKVRSIAYGAIPGMRKAYSHWYAYSLREQFVGWSSSSGYLRKIGWTQKLFDADRV